MVFVTNHGSIFSGFFFTNFKLFKIIADVEFRVLSFIFPKYALSIKKYFFSH